MVEPANASLGMTTRRAKAIIATIEADRTELVVTRQDHEPMVIVALSEWEGMRETLHLLSSPANADHLRRSIHSYEEGKASEQELQDR